MDTVLEMINKVAPQLVNLFSKINPTAGAVVGILLTALMVYLGWKASRGAWDKSKQDAGGTIGEQTGPDQEASKGVQDRLEEFLKGSKK
jgi:Na+/H+-translocating membrane pyrophosphatase